MYVGMFARTRRTARKALFDFSNSSISLLYVFCILCGIVLRWGYDLGQFSIFQDIKYIAANSPKLSRWLPAFSEVNLAYFCTSFWRSPTPILVNFWSIPCIFSSPPDKWIP